MPTAAESIAAWTAAGNPNMILCINDADVAVLPPLPAGLTHLRCGNCDALTALGELPATLTHLECWDCDALTALGELPAALTLLDCDGCTALTRLPPLPAALKVLHCHECTALTCLGKLPAALDALYCGVCTSLARLGNLPDTMRSLHCGGCAAVHRPPPLPAALVDLICDVHVLLPTFPANVTNFQCTAGTGFRLTKLSEVRLAGGLPDACPNGLRFNGDSAEGSRVEWRAAVAAQHAAHRRRVAASLPPLALLYV